MKKLIAMLMLLGVLLAAAGCGGQKDSDTPREDPPAPGESMPAGAGEAVVPEEGDIVIDIG